MTRLLIRTLKKAIREDRSVDVPAFLLVLTQLMEHRKRVHDKWKAGVLKRIERLEGAFKEQRADLESLLMDYLDDCKEYLSEEDRAALDQIDVQEVIKRAREEE